MTKLVDEKPPFGVVIKQQLDVGQRGPDVAPRPRPSLGPTTQVPNNGRDHGPSYGQYAPGAEAMASRHRDNPFYWTGKPEKGNGK